MLDMADCELRVSLCAMNSPKIIIHFIAHVQLNSHEAGEERIFIETVFIFG